MKTKRTNLYFSCGVRDAIRAYNLFIDGDPLGGLDREEDTLEFLLASIRHYCVQQGISYKEIDKRASILFDAESAFNA